MNRLKQQVKINEAVAHLQKLQSDFSSLDLQGHLRAKPILDMDVSSDNFVIYFDLNKDTDFTIIFNADYHYGELVNIDVAHIEADSYQDGTYVIENTDNSALILEAKRLIHDAVHYKLVDEDSEIETDFYDDVYA